MCLDKLSASKIKSNNEHHSTQKIQKQKTCCINTNLRIVLTLGYITNLLWNGRAEEQSEIIQGIDGNMMTTGIT